MAIPRAALGAGIGAGVGALTGGGIGAATAKDSKSRKGRTLKGALLGGAVGALGGGLTHGALRTKGLAQKGFIPHKRMAGFDYKNAATLRGTDPTIRGVIRKGQQGMGTIREGFLGSKSMKDIVKADPFMGSSTAGELKKVYRAQSRNLHPDVGGSDNAFSEMKAKYDRHRSLRFAPKTASITFWSSFADELEKLSAKDPTKIKVPKVGTNLKGMERYTANPGKTPITEPGKANLSKATVSGLGRMNDSVGRSATSANPTPPPPPVT